MVVLILDVGCGINPLGDINVDLRLGGNYGVQKTAANLYASAYNLPFRNKVFHIVRFKGLLHHLANPGRAWNEMMRVAIGVVVGVEPNFNLFLPRDKTESHHLYRERMIRSIVGLQAEIRRGIHLVKQSNLVESTRLIELGTSSLSQSSFSLLRWLPS